MSAQPKFTPGPWAVELNKNAFGWVDVDGPSFSVDGPTMATDLTAADMAQRIADARLIAAAPDMFAALECLEIAATGAGVPHPKERALLHECITAARAALAKARGQA